MNRPNINIPSEFASNGTKIDFPEPKILNGFDPINPDVLPGDCLNKFIDDTYKGLNGVLELYKGAVLYDATETYTNKSLVFNITDGNIELYHSLQNNNIGNALTDSNYWELVQLGGSGEIGDIIWRLLPSQDAGKHLLDGALIQGTGATADFVNYIADLYADNPSANYFTDEGTWQSTVMSYGACGKFVYDDVNNTVRLPKVTGIVEGTIDLNALGDLVEAGLPNIAASTTMVISSRAYPATGAFSWSAYQNKQNTTEGGSYWQEGTMNYSASRSSSLYKNNFNKVQPQTIKGYYYIVIANTKKTNYTINIDNVMTDLYGKADVDLTNCTKPHITETYINGASWYRVYSDGWCEQGGKASQNTTFLKPYINTNYTITLGKLQSNNTTDNAVLNIYTKSTTGFTLYRGWGSGSGSPASEDMWQTCGYIR